MRLNLLVLDFPNSEKVINGLFDLNERCRANIEFRKFDIERETLSLLDEKGIIWWVYAGGLSREELNKLSELLFTLNLIVVYDEHFKVSDYKNYNCEMVNRYWLDGNCNDDDVLDLIARHEIMINVFNNIRELSDFETR